MDTHQPYCMSFYAGPETGQYDCNCGKTLKDVQEEVAALKIELKMVSQDRDTINALYKAACDSMNPVYEEIMTRLQERDSQLAAMTQERDALKAAVGDTKSVLDMMQRCIDRERIRADAAEQSLAAGWDAETVKRQVADFNALTDKLAEVRADLEDAIQKLGELRKDDGLREYEKLKAELAEVRGALEWMAEIVDSCEARPPGGQQAGSPQYAMTPYTRKELRRIIAKALPPPAPRRTEVG